MKEKESLGLTECESTLVMKYNRPATDSYDGLIVGNGRIAANICGTERETERVMLSHAKLYSAVCAERAPEEPLRSRMLLSRAHMLLGGMPESGTPYAAAADGLPTDSDTAPLEAGIAMPAGVLSLTELDAFGSPISGGEFARELDLRNAAVKSGRAIGSLIVKREFFASHGELGNLCIRLSASKPITWQLRLSEIPADPDAVYRADSAAGALSAEGIASGCRFVTALHIESTDGKIQADVDSLTVSGAKTLTAYLAVSVSDAARTDSIFSAFQCGSYEAAFTEHKKVYSELFGVCDINIAASEAERRESSALTLDALLSGYRAGRYRSLVPMLYFNLGRNLLISSAGVLPLPTQKLWNGLKLPAGLQPSGCRLCDISALAESILTEHDGVINLLPALPEEWSTGKASGLRCAGYTVDLEWIDGAVRRVTVDSHIDGECVLSAQGLRACSATSASLRAEASVSDGTVHLNTAAGSRYFLELDCRTL